MSLAPRRVLFLVASARAAGNGETLARRAEAGLPPSVAREWSRLDDVPLPPFVDRRHAAGSDGTDPEPAGNEAVLLDATLAATDVVFVASRPGDVLADAAALTTADGLFRDR
jgi:NAD(P)H-dependent FMN reductase